MVALHGTSLSSRAATGFALGTLTGMGTAAWLPSGLSELGAAGATELAGLFVAAAWVKGAPFALFGAVWGPAEGLSPLRRCLALCGTWALLEMLLTRPPLGVPWALLGYSQGDALGVAQLALVGGPPLISALLVAMNVAAAGAVRSGAPRVYRRLFLATMVAWLALVVGGLPTAQALRPNAVLRDKRILVVQPNVARGERWAKALQVPNVTRIGRATAQAVREHRETLDLVVWPENTTTLRVHADSELVSELAHLVRPLGVPVLLGMARMPSQPTTQGIYRSSIALQSGDAFRFVIDKALAIPVLEAAEPVVGQRLFEQAFGGAAKWPKVESSPAIQPASGLPVNAALVLCYEALFPGVVARRRPPGAEVIVVLADESWAGSTAASEQLANIARFRAIEQRLPLIRVAHGGLSAFMSPFGEYVERLPTDQFATSVATVGVTPPPTILEQAGILALPVASGWGSWGILGLRLRKAAREQAWSS